MPVCYTCGNDYDKTFTVTVASGETYHFDSIECAARQIAPACEQCGTTILGHGLEADGRYFCCDHCAQGAGVEGLRDSL